MRAGGPEAALFESEQRRLLAVEAAGVGDWTFDVATGILECSPVARAMHRAGLDEPITLEAHDRLMDPADRAAVQAVRAAAMDPAGGGHYRAEFRFRYPDGDVRWFESVGQAVFADGPAGRRATHVLGAMLDVTDRVRAHRAVERAWERADRLQAITAALAAATTPEEAADIVVTRGVAATGAATAMLALRRAAAPGAAARPRACEDAVVLRQVGLPAGRGLLGEGDLLPLDAPGPAAACLRTGEAAFLESREALLDRFADTAYVWDALGSRALATVPLTVGGETVGAMSFTWNARRHITGELRTFLLALGQQAGLALERARLLAAEREARVAAERLQALTAALAGARTVDEVATVVVSDMVVALGARTGALAVHARGTDHLALVRHVGFAPEVATRFERQPLDAAAPVPDCYRGAAPIFFESRDGADGFDARYPAHGAAWDALGVSAAAYVPLVAAGETVGVISFAFGAPRGFSPAKRAFLLALGQQAALAVERARLFEAERDARSAAEAAQERAERARREADDASRAKSGFLATMSHELRTPINAIIGYADLLEMGLGGPLTPQQRAYLGRLTASGQHLLGLVNDVLDLAKIEAGQTRVARRDAATGPAVRAALDLVRPQASGKGVRLVDARPDEVGVPYVGDDDRVRQIVLNLLSNAVKFTAPGGAVTVTCDTVEATPPEAAHLEGAGPWAFVRVEDTGVGIAPEEQARIFDPFHQVENGHTRRQGGTGLGLAISRRLARLMGGDLTVASTPGAGSTFTLWLPAARRAGAAQVETAADRSARAHCEAALLQAPGVGRVGALLREHADAILSAYVDRLRADAATPSAHAMRPPQLEDHQVTLVADLAQSLVLVDDAGPEAAAMLKDGSAIQRIVAEHHGARRHAQGWDEGAVRRDHQILREEIERVVRERLAPAGGDAHGAGAGDAADAADSALRVLLGLVERAEALSVQAWRRAADEAAPAGDPAPADGENA